MMNDKARSIVAVIVPTKKYIRHGWYWSVMLLALSTGCFLFSVFSGYTHDVLFSVGASLGGTAVVRAGATMATAMMRNRALQVLADNDEVTSCYD